MADFKKSRLILILIVVGVVIGVIAVCFFSFFNRDKHILDGPGMEYDPTYDITGCSYYYGGGMENSYISYDMTVDENQIVTVVFTSKKADEVSETTKTVTVPYSAITQIRDICRECGTPDWKELPTTELILDDALTASITIRFRDNFLTIKDTHILPEEGKGFFTRIYNVLENHFNQGVD